MKNKSLKLLFCTAVLSMVLVVSACGGKKAEDTSQKDTPTPEVTEEVQPETTEAPEDTETPETTEAPEEPEEDVDDSDEGDAVAFEKFPNIEMYVESEEVQSQLDEMVASIEEQGMKMEVLGEDNKLIYRYTFTNMEKQDGMAEQLEKAMGTQAETFTMIANSLETIVDVEDPMVVIEYLDVNGEEIYTAEFKAE